ncbi:MFS transporter [Sanguibacter sp. Z1732]|uniref:MFS transporter n=1 Tax=Sanguibacter sp. Z1732 TaxID=3435412 RepID=UPI003D9C7CEE
MGYHYEEPPRATARQWLGLVLLVLPMIAVASDLTVLFFALPSLTQDLQPSAGQALWIVHVYGFLIAGFLLVAGRVGDRIGPRRLLLMGSAVFGALSLVAAMSTSAAMLIGARAALGVAGATLMPSLLSLLRTMFADPDQRRLAIAVVFSSFTVGGAIGPLLGGALLEFFWWGSVFLLNVPPMLLLVILGTALLPEREVRNRAPIELRSVILSVAGMLALVYGLQGLVTRQESGSGSGWTYLVAVVAGAGALALFLRRQGRLAEPVFDLGLLRNTRVGAALLVLLLTGVAGVGTFYLFTQHLQLVVGLSALHAGLWTLPFIVLNILGAMLAPRLARWMMPLTAVAGGLTVAALGALLLALTATPDAPLLAQVAGIATVGLGMGPAMALLSDLIVSSAPESKAGSAAAAQEVSGELGSAMGIAAAGALALVMYRTYLTGRVPPHTPPEAAEAARGSAHEGFLAGREWAATAPELPGLIREATVAGLQAYAGFAAVMIAIVAAGVTVVRVRTSRPSVPADDPAPAVGSVPADGPAPAVGSVPADGRLPQLVRFQPMARLPQLVRFQPMAPLQQMARFP